MTTVNIHSQSLALSIEDVQEMTGLGRTKIYQLINSGQIKCKKIGKRSLVLRVDLEKFLSDLEAYPVTKGGQ